MRRHERYARLRGLRAERKWTQLQLALKAKLNQSRISLIENGYGEPSDVERERIAKAFDLPQSEVFPEPEQVAS